MVHVFTFLHLIYLMYYSMITSQTVIVVVETVTVIVIVTEVS